LLTPANDGRIRANDGASEVNGGCTPVNAHVALMIVRTGIDPSLVAAMDYRQHAALSSVSARR
jgi:hypothetical protein